MKTVALAVGFLLMSCVGFAQPPIPCLQILTASPLTPGLLGVAYSQTLSATDYCAQEPYTYTWLVTSGALPAGLTLASGGTLSGTPAALGSFSFTVQVTDTVGRTASAAFTLTVTDPTLPVIATSSPLPLAPVGDAYSQTLRATGGSPPYTWSVTSGALPVGLTLSSGGTISGTPITVGSFTFTVTVQTSASKTSTGTFTLTVVAAGAYVITTVAGNGTLAYGGDGGPATSAQLPSPKGIAVDASGNLYIADQIPIYSYIRKVSPSGIITTVAGGGNANPGDGGPATSAMLSNPYGVALDGAGNLYVGDTGNNRVRKVSPGGTITTVAGDGTSAYGGDGGPATSAQLPAPKGLAFDASGNLYIADQLITGTYVRKVSPSGVITTVAGGGNANPGDGGPATSAQLGNPSGVAVDGLGNLYVAETGNNRIRKVSPNGIITTIAGNGTYGYSGDGGPAAEAQLSNPSGVAVDGFGNIFIADSSNNRIRMVSPSGIITTVAGSGPAGYSGDGGPATSAQLYYPIGVTVTGAGDVYIGDTNNNRVRLLRRAGLSVITTSPLPQGTVGAPYSQALSAVGGTAPYTWSAASGALPGGLALSSSGMVAGTPTTPGSFNFTVGVQDSASKNTAGAFTITVVAAGTSIITTVAGTGYSGFSGDGGPATGARLDSPYGVALDGFGNIYIADTLNSRVHKVSPNGALTTVAGNGIYGYSGDGGPATSAQLADPVGLAVDGSGNLYIGDTNNNRVRKVSPGGVISTFAGGWTLGLGDGGPASAAQLSGPQGLALDGSGSLYIADMYDNRIRKVLPNGLITTVAGSGTYGYSGDGGPATAARLSYPSGVTIDGSGAIFIADTYNQAVRKVSAFGTITTVAGTGAGGYSGDGGPAASAQLYNPSGVAVDGSGNLYIADTSNNRIRAVAPNGIIATVAGTGVGGYSGDGGLARSAQLNYPAGVAVDGSGNVYIADTYNHSIRAVRLAGVAGLFVATAPPLAQGTVGIAYLQALSATGGAAPYTWSVTSGALPGGLALASGGTISGTPTTAGSFSFTLRVMDSTEATASATFTLTIAATAPPSITTSSTLPKASAGIAYSVTLNATGGNPPYTWSLTSGALPAGLTLSGAGVIAGTPAAAGVYSFTAQVRDNSSLTASQAFSLTVTAAGVLPREGVISQIAAGGGWVTTIWLVNRSSAPVQTSLVFHGDDGSPLSLPLTVTQGASVQQVTASTLNEVIAPNATLVVATGALVTNVEGWADVLGNGLLSGFAVFQYAGGAEAAVPLQTQIGTSFTLPFDNTGGFSTGVAVANLSGSPARITATVWDGEGNLLLVQPVTLTRNDPGGNGHDAFMLPDRLAVTAGRRGIVQFQGNPGSAFAPAGQLTGLGLRTDPNGLFTSIPTIVP